MRLVMIAMIVGVCDNDNGAGCGAGLGWAGLGWAGCCTLLPDVSLCWWWWWLVAGIGVKTVANHQHETLAAVGWLGTVVMST